MFNTFRVSSRKKCKYQIVLARVAVQNNVVSVADTASRILNSERESNSNMDDESLSIAVAAAEMI
jgi:hypothetical protein